ncbi:hypothetical protein OG21DRAFT_355233 [Imleria badia]|nr:hypothetical protein OG21DRAFT_355233 [Imleria badia]
MAISAGLINTIMVTPARSFVAYVTHRMHRDLGIASTNMLCTSLNGRLFKLILGTSSVHQDCPLLFSPGNSPSILEAIIRVWKRVEHTFRPPSRQSVQRGFRHWLRLDGRRSHSVDLHPLFRHQTSGHGFLPLPKCGSDPSSGLSAEDELCTF